jgi:queuine tRNA-ribosyltransferase
MNRRPHDFRLLATAGGSRARAGVLETLHGPVLTPVFMPVGTQATVKAQLPQTLLDSGSQVLLANTYHLLLRPGPEVMRRMGGIHRFMSWPRAVLTDSGGYQVFSLPGARTIAEEGATFRSYVDQRTVLLSPESSIATQIAIGADIMMAFDHCVASTADLATARAAADLTARWALRSLQARGESPQALFGIVQGALFPDLRRECVARLAEMPFDGYAIGGLAVGESRSEREEMCALTAEQMPQDKPRYLMGVGTPLDLLEAVHRGVDMFDCIIPTQVAQRGGAFTSRGYLQMRRTVHAMSDTALDPDCDCPTCPRHSRAYLHHLIKVREPLGWQLLGQHNLHFYHRLMREVRESILADRFAELYRARRELLAADDLDNPVTHSRVRTVTTAAKAAALSRRVPTSSTWRPQASRASATSPRARPCMRARRRSRRRALSTSSSRRSRAAAAARRGGSGGRRAAGDLGRGARSCGQRDGRDPLLRGGRRGRRAPPGCAVCASSASRAISIRSASPCAIIGTFPICITPRLAGCSPQANGSRPVMPDSSGACGPETSPRR